MTSDTQDLKALVEQAHEAVACLKEEDAELHRIAFQQVLQHLLTNGAPPAKDQSAAPAREMPPFDRVFGSERHRVAGRCAKARSRTGAGTSTLRFDGRRACLAHGRVEIGA